MKRRHGALWLLLITLLALPLTAPPASANSAEPPGFTIIAAAPPEGMTVSLLFEGEEPIALDRQQKGWETYYRYYYIEGPRGEYDLADGQLLVTWDGGAFTCALPLEGAVRYNSLLTMNMEEQCVDLGQRPWRTPLLVALRVVLTLLVEGAVFWLFGYRQKNSWAIFLITNLITQGALNLLFTGPQYTSYWILGYVLVEIVVFLVEMAVFARTLREHGKRRAALCALGANGASLVLGGLILTYLPI